MIEASMREKMGLVRMWLASYSVQEQGYERDRADQEFAWFCEQAKLLGTVSPITRSQRTTFDEDTGEPRFIYYRLSATVQGTVESISRLKDIVDKKGPPIMRGRMVSARYTLADEQGRQILVSCCFCPNAFTVRVGAYWGTKQYHAESDIFCPHCHTRIVEGHELEVIPTSEEQAEDMRRRNERY